MCIHARKQQHSSNAYSFLHLRRKSACEKALNTSGCAKLVTLVTIQLVSTITFY